MCFGFRGRGGGRYSDVGMKITFAMQLSYEFFRWLNWLIMTPEGIMTGYRIWICTVLVLVAARFLVHRIRRRTARRALRLARD